MNLRKSIVILLVAIMLIGAFLEAGNFLVEDELPKKVDVIVVLAGDKGYRTEYGVKLFKEGYASKLIFTGGEIYKDVTAAALMKKHAVDLGVLEKDIVLEEKADSTYENAAFTKELMLKNKFNSAIIVSSNYHMKRSKMLFDRVFKDTNINLIYCASNDQYFNPNKWWASNKSVMITFNEYLKFIGYFWGKNS